MAKRRVKFKVLRFPFALVIFGHYIGFGKGATAWEFQVSRLQINITHLRGDHWRWKPWRRVRVFWWDEAPRYMWFKEDV